MKRSLALLATLIAAQVSPRILAQEPPGGIDLFEGVVTLDLDPVLIAAEDEEAIDVVNEGILEVGGLEAVVTWVAEGFQDVAEPPPKPHELAALARLEGFQDVAEPPPKLLRPLEPKISPEEIEDVLESAATAVEALFEETMEVRYQRVLTHLKLPPERREKLARAKEAAVQDLAKAWREEMRGKIPEMSKNERQRLARGWASQANDRLESATWNQALEELLSETERKILSRRIVDARERRQEALMAIAIAELDDFIGFGVEQRTQLLALGAPLLKNLVDTQNGHTYINLTVVFQTVRKDAALLNLLDAQQVKVWEAMDDGDIDPNRGYLSLCLVDDIPELNDPVDAEVFVSRMLLKAANQEREQQAKTMTAQLQVVTRVTGADEAAVRQLKIAAKGAVEERARYQINQMHNYLARQLSTIDPLKTPERLKQMYVPRWSHGRRNQDEAPGVWKEAVQRLLSEKQRAALQAHRTQAEQWRREALADLTLTEIEKYVPVPLMRQEFLRQRLLDVITQFDEPFGQTFFQGWYSQGPYNCMPLEMIHAMDGGLQAYFDEEDVNTLRERCLTHTGQHVEQFWSLGTAQWTPPELLRP